MDGETLSFLLKFLIGLCLALLCEIGPSQSPLHPPPNYDPAFLLCEFAPTPEPAVSCSLCAQLTCLDLRSSPASLLPTSSCFSGAYF